MPHGAPGGSRRDRLISRIDVAKTAIAGDHVRHAGVEGLVLAVPVHFAGTDVDHRAPRRIAVTRVAWRHSQAQQHRRAADCQYDPLHGLRLGFPPTLGFYITLARCDYSRLDKNQLVKERRQKNEENRLFGTKREFF